MTYGTIPTSSSSPHGPSSNREYISRAKDRIITHLGDCRPWREFLDVRNIGLPSSFRDLLSRVKLNFTFFRMNYAIVGLLILFLSLIWHPISLVVFVVMVMMWLFFYFLREEPWVIFHRTIDDRVVMIVLSVLTVGLLLLTKATMNVIVSVSISVVVVVVHALLWKTDDLELGDAERGGDGARGLNSSGSAGSS